MTSIRSARGAPEAALSGSGTRAVLIGTGTHAPDSGLPNVPAVRTTLLDLRQALIRRCGVAERNVKVLTDPRSPRDVGRVLTESAKQATEVLLVCYVGHGLVSPRGELYLATKSTERELLAYTALAYTTVRTSLLLSSASSIVVILDCCFSGIAMGVLGASNSATAADLAQVTGGYVLTSAASEEVALAPQGARHTAFTGELIDLLTRGDPKGPASLTLRDTFQYLARVLPASGCPKPHCRASESIEKLVLAPNIAYCPPGDISPVPDVPDLSDVSAGDVLPYPESAAPQAEDAERAHLRDTRRIRQLITSVVILLVLSLTGGGIALIQNNSTAPQRSMATVLTGHTNSVDAVAYSPDSHTLATGSADRTVRLWNVTNPGHPKLLGSPLTGHSRFVDAVAFSPDGHTLASACTDRTVRLWNVTDPTHPTPLGSPLTGHTNSVQAVAFSPDGHTLASASIDRTVWLWDVTHPADPTPLGPLTGHTDSVRSVAFSPEGHTLASASTDRTVRLWNVTDPTHPTPLGPPLTGHTDSVNSVRFSPDGHTLASASTDRTVRLWSLP